MPYNFVPDSFHTPVTAEALRAKIDRKSAILHQRGHFDLKFQVQGVTPPLEMGIEPNNEGSGSVRFGQCYSSGSVRVRLILC